MKSHTKYWRWYIAVTNASVINIKQVMKINILFTRATHSVGYKVKRDEIFYITNYNTCKNCHHTTEYSYTLYKWIT